MWRQRQWRIVTPIIHTRVPLIKATHGYTGRQCDFSFPDHMYSIYNTQLIVHLLARDRRIRPLTMLLKYWFRVNGIAGTGKFTSFGLFMMIVFYLQVNLCFLLVMTYMTYKYISGNSPTRSATADRFPAQRLPTRS